MQLATSGPATGFMYKEVSFRGVSKPGRITVLGFAFSAQKEALRPLGSACPASGHFGGFNLRLKNRL